MFTSPHLQQAQTFAPKHYISGLEGGADYLQALLGLVQDLKTNAATLRETPLLPRRIMTALFLNPSLRTRTSMEAAMHKLGGHMVALSPGTGSWGLEFSQGATMDGPFAEHIIEAAGALSSYSDILGMRAFASMQDFAKDMADQPIKELAKHAQVPVISLESAMWHPCQALADAVTLSEHLGKVKGKKFTLAWAKHPKMCGVAVPHSALVTAARLGMHVTLAHPEHYDLHPEVVGTARQLAHASGGSLHCTDKLDEACHDADVIYAKAWGAPCDYGDPETGNARNMSHHDWTIDETHLGQAAFMHCLPIRRNVVATDAVLDGTQSLVQPQAGNRLWAQMALVLSMINQATST